MSLMRPFCLLLLLLVTSLCRADWINLTGAETAPNTAEIYIMDDHVRVNLEVFVSDLDRFPELVPDSWFADDSANRPSLEQRMRSFATERLQFVTETGEALPARLQRVEARMRVDRKSPYAGMINPLTRTPVPKAPEDKRVLYAEIHYPFENKPKRLKIIPPLTDQGVAAATIGFIAYHKSVPVIDFRYLGLPATLTLDWRDPWYSKFENRNLKRHHKSALMSFLYVEPYEVRHEILTRVKDLENWMQLGLRNPDYIEVDELEPLKARIGEFLLGRNPVTIDGTEVRPILDRSSFVKVGLRGIQLLESPERLEVSTAIVGVIITYLTSELPQEVSVDWDLFTDQIERVPATATDPAGPYVSYITRDDGSFTWTNYLKKYRVPTVEQVAVRGTLGSIRIPLVSLAGALAGLMLIGMLWYRQRRRLPLRVAGVSLVLATLVAVVAWPYARVDLARPALIAADLDEQQSRVLLQAMLKNVYRAFDFRDEEDVYDKLALSVDGELLADIYLQNRKSFAVQRAGGAQARVKSVDILSASAARDDGDVLAYRIRGNWTATGSVGHWGHIHQRENLYNAEIRVEAVDGKWKITELEIIEEKRIEPGSARAQATSATESNFVAGSG